MKRLIPFLLILTLLLCGCGVEEEIPTTGAPTATTESTAASSEATVGDSTVETKAPTATYRHPLNGTLLEEPYTGRPVTFTVGNTAESLPQHGIGKADILYEITVEAGETRLMPVFSDLTGVKSVGSIRSARTYFVSISRAYDAVFMHSGASVYAGKLFNQGVVDHVNADPSVFYRDADRAAAGYAYEHRHFVSVENALEYMKKNFETTTKPDTSYGLDFVDEQTLKGDDANTVKVNFGTGTAKSVTFAYNKDTGNYTAKHAKGDWKDGSNNELLRFENLLILYAKKTGAPGATTGNVLHELVGENTGYYVCGGKVVPIKWTRAEEDAPFTYTLEDGTPLKLIPGKTYIGIVPLKSPIEFK